MEEMGANFLANFAQKAIFQMPIPSIHVFNWDNLK